MPHIDKICVDNHVDKSNYQPTLSPVLAYASVSYFHAFLDTNGERRKDAWIFEDVLGEEDSRVDDIS